MVYNIYNYIDDLIYNKLKEELCNWLLEDSQILVLKNFNNKIDLDFINNYIEIYIFNNYNKYKIESIKYEEFLETIKNNLLTDIQIDLLKGIKGDLLLQYQPEINYDLLTDKAIDFVNKFNIGITGYTGYAINNIIINNDTGIDITINYTDQSIYKYSINYFGDNCKDSNFSLKSDFEELFDNVE